MLRPPGPCTVPAAAGLTIQRAGDAHLFERIAFLAASGTPPDRPGELHPRGSEQTPGLHLLLAYLDDQPIGSALALAHDRGLFISAVAVIAAHRGKGIGRSLTAAAINCARDRPATLSASKAGLGIYRQLGFELVATPLDWKPTDR
jgi:GNAT superfamily N-acetyltransferase